jgi:hypothetical protein
MERSSREQAARQDAKGDALCLQAVNDVAQMPDRARQAINFRDHQGIAFACEFDGSLKLLTRRDRTDVLAEQFLGSRPLSHPESALQDRRPARWSKSCRSQ